MAGEEQMGVVFETHRLSVLVLKVIFTRLTMRGRQCIIYIYKAKNLELPFITYILSDRLGGVC